MKLVKRFGVLACVAILGAPVFVFAQQLEPGMKQDHQMGGMQQQGKGGMGMMDMCQMMQGMSGDSTMMEGMGSRRQHISEMRKHLREMKKHLNMMDEMMDDMMDRMMMKGQRGTMPSAPESESESQEHHPAESK